MGDQGLWRHSAEPLSGRQRCCEPQESLRNFCAVLWFREAMVWVSSLSLMHHLASPVQLLPTTAGHSQAFCSLLNSLNICFIINRQSQGSCPIKKRRDGSHWDNYQLRRYSLLCPLPRGKSSSHPPFLGHWDVAFINY